MLPTEFESKKQEEATGSSRFKAIVIKDSEDSDSDLDSLEVTQQFSVPDGSNDFKNKNLSLTTIPSRYSLRKIRAVVTPADASGLAGLADENYSNFSGSSRANTTDLVRKNEWDSPGVNSLKRSRNENPRSNQERSLGVPLNPNFGDQMTVSNLMGSNNFVSKQYTPYHGNMFENNQVISGFGETTTENRLYHTHASPIPKRPRLESSNLGSSLYATSNMNSNISGKGKQTAGIDSNDINPGYGNRFRAPNFSRSERITSSESSCLVPPQGQPSSSNIVPFSEEVFDTSGFDDDEEDYDDWNTLQYPYGAEWDEASVTRPENSVLLRGQRQRERLEAHHPELKTMWKELENLPGIGEVTIEQPKNINRELKPFQLQGVAWMLAMEKTEWGGGLLGDEMGMGKTIQAVSLVMSDWPAKLPTLILIPPVALLQWQQEIESYTNGNLKTFVFHGTNQMTKKMTKSDIMKYNVILMSYNSLESIYRKQEKGFKRKFGICKEKSVIHEIKFHRIILDEAHNIKSRNSGCAKACFNLQANHKWCLSGTPLQNRIGEFFSLIRFLDIRPFTYYLCKQCPCASVKWDMDEFKKCKSCQHSAMQHVSVFNQELLNPIQKHGNKGPGAEAFRKLRILTSRFMLRRVKRDHTSSMELPAKEIYVDRQFFGEEENDFATSIMSNGTRKFETYVAQGVVLNNYANIFGLILQMRQVADHPDLVLKKNSEGGQNLLVCCICDETAEEAIQSACRHDFCRECVTYYIKSSEAPDCPRCHIQLSIDLEQPEIEQDEIVVKKSSIINRIKMEKWTSSSKIETLVHDLYKLRSKNMTHKSIIFSQFTTMLQLVEWRLRRAGITTVMLDGTMTPAQRQASINHFMSNVNVECFLVSLKAGGVALNLTEASKVFIVDPWWNPAAEWQSADRCHRIGQARPCSITRLCIEDSVESRMVLLQEKKTNMINSTINADDSAMESLTTEDMQFLFRGLS